jgi:hypothetical protein
VSNKLNERRKEQWGIKLESFDQEFQSLWNMTTRVMRIPIPSTPLVSQGGLALSDCNKFGIVADGLETLFQAVNDLSLPSVNRVVNEAMQNSSLAPARRHFH